MKQALGLGLWGLFAAVLLSSAVSQKKEAKLQGYDLIFAKHDSVSLQVKLEKRGTLGINPDLHKIDVLFLWKGEELGRAKTAHEGLAGLSWTPPKDLFLPGAQPSFEIEAKLPEDSEWAATPSRFGVYFWSPTQPVIVVDLDGTVCASAELEVGLKLPSQLQCVEGAPEALREIVKTHHILYLTARDDALMNATREWLDLRGFPKGPVLFRDLSLWNLSAETYKRERLMALKKSWNLVAGVGDRDEDAKSYMAAGMEAYLVGKPVKIPQGARKLAHWSEVAKLIAAPSPTK